MMQNAAKPSDFYNIPANRLVELGAKVEIWNWSSIFLFSY
jgi:KUP system potassium uptake protein